MTIRGQIENHEERLLKLEEALFGKSQTTTHTTSPRDWRPTLEECQKVEREYSDPMLALNYSPTEAVLIATYRAVFGPKIEALLDAVRLARTAINRHIQPELCKILDETLEKATKNV
jgi:hypothetical protein